MLIKKLNDVLAGTILFAIGAGFALGSTQYRLGTLSQMGPGYFPFVVSLLLALAGFCVLIGGFRGDHEPLEHFAWPRLGAVVVAIGVFAFTVRPIGLIPAASALIVISLLASGRFSPVGALVLAACGSVMSYLIFVVGLTLPLSAFGTWWMVR